jgi:hypothetical protein
MREPPEDQQENDDDRGRDEDGRPGPRSEPMEEPEPGRDEDKEDR